MATKKVVSFQGRVKRAVSVDRGDWSSVTSVAAWYREGHFDSEEEAMGAFKLAYQQGMDGMGTSPQQWMGLTDTEFSAWMRNNALPKRSRSKK